ncbi:MAG: 16S rRNA (adenine(1518)-N(6)/adenine(1519)-N(6))-dimethyltransferase RsmA [Minisyncoccia bacterium]|jgi:16S rRNA (adenine1518-N6/adenine1519-N6)-dimethyltransferase
MPNKFLGQHFLKNAAIAQKIVAALQPEHGDVIFEIGAGHGELTRLLAEACTKNGCELFAIEKDRHLAGELAQRFKTNGVEIIADDALAFFTSSLPEKSRGRSYKIVGNIPYYFTGRLFRVVSELEAKPARCVLMVQKEVAERIAAKPPKMNRLAASVQFWADVKVIAPVPRENFLPAPKVDSAIISLDLTNDKKRAENIPADHYYAAVRSLFAQPRKTVLNNLGGHGTQEEREMAASILKKIGVPQESRPQNLTVEEIMAIAKAILNERFGDNHMA